MCLNVSNLHIKGAMPNWEQFRSAQVPSQLAPIGSYWSNCVCVCVLCVLDKSRADYTLARGPLKCGAQLGAIGPLDLRPALRISSCFLPY